MDYRGGFSEFEVKNSTIKFKSANSTDLLGCVGSLEEAMESKTITKKCEGVITKSVARGTGSGELKINLHIRRNAYVQGMGMNVEGLVSGVKAYGRNSVHEPFVYTAKVYDEDGDEMYKAYPNCVFKEKPTIKIENGAEEVAEIEATISVMPDEHGNGVYEALADDLSAEVKEAWLNNFTPALVHQSAEGKTSGDADNDGETTGDGENTGDNAGGDNNGGDNGGEETQQPSV